MGLKKLLDIKPKEFRETRKVLRALSVLGLTQEDLMVIKEIPQMKSKIAELEEFKRQVTRTAAEDENKAMNPFATLKELGEVFGTPTREYDPDAK